MGGYILGLISGALRKNSILACTVAVEDVVIRHLQHQLNVLEEIGDQSAFDAVSKIVADERSHHGV